LIQKKIYNKKSVGASGTEISANTYTEEYLTALRGYQASAVYDKMRRSDAQIKKILNAIMNPIKSAVWEIVPASDSKQDLSAAALIKQILFKDMSWIKKLSEILTFLVHGFSCFEIIHENKINKEIGEYTGLSDMAFRHQSTLTEWEHDRTSGKLAKIHQIQTGDLYTNVWMSAENLLLFFNEQEGDNNGVSILRPLYGPYKRKLLCQELKIIGIERFAIPTPLVKAPSNIKPSDAEYKSAITVFEEFTSAENSYIIYPEGWEVELVTNTFDPSKVEATIKAENEEMSGAIVAMFLELGTGGNSGAYALGTDMSDFFLTGIEHYATIIKDAINTELIPNLIYLNYGDSINICPELSVSGISDKAGLELMQVLTGYSNAGLFQFQENASST